MPSRSEPRPFPYPYDTDLHWLWGWGERLRLRIADDRPANKYDWMTFRPDDKARDAMMHLSVSYTHVIKQIDDYLDFSEGRFKVFLENGNEDNSVNFVQAIDDLQKRIERGAETIGLAEAARQSSMHSVDAIGCANDANDLVECLLALASETHDPVAIERDWDIGRGITETLMSRVGLVAPERIVSSSFSARSRLPLQLLAESVRFAWESCPAFCKAGPSKFRRVDFDPATVRELAARMKRATDGILKTEGENDSEAGAVSDKPKVTWQEAAEKLERLRSQGESFVSQAVYGERFGCSTATINKAIHKTPSLQTWAGCDSAARRDQTPMDIVADDRPQEREASPDSYLDSNAVEKAMKYLIDQAAAQDRSEFRAKLEAMPSDERMKLADTVYRDPEHYEALTGGRYTN